MSEIKYQLVFDGQICDGFDIEEVKKKCAEVFSLSPAVIAKLFSSSSTVLNKNLDAATGHKHVERFLKIGMIAHLKPLANNTLGLEPIGSDSNSSQDHTTPEDTSHANTSQAFDTATNNTTTQAASPPSYTQPAQAEANITEAPFKFHGKSREYFGIWIVNILLSIITLGIYSAWAKVRNKRYFYANTEFNGAHFEYVADPVKILIGRIIAFTFVMLYTFSELISFGFFIFMFFVLMAALPLIIRQSLRFNAKNSLYRNVPFVFNGSILGAYQTFLFWPLLMIPTFGLLFPFVVYKQQTYIWNNHQYGTLPFQFNASPGQFYSFMLICLGVLIGSYVLFFIFMAITALSQSPFFIVIGTLAIFAAYFFAFCYYAVNLKNIQFNQSELNQTHGFVSTWDTISFAKLSFVNILIRMLLITGFWVKIRNARYAAAHLTGMIDGDLENIAKEEQKQVSAIGEGFADGFDFDVGL